MHFASSSEQAGDKYRSLCEDVPCRPESVATISDGLRYFARMLTAIFLAYKAPLFDFSSSAHPAPGSSHLRFPRSAATMRLAAAFAALLFIPFSAYAAVAPKKRYVHLPLPSMSNHTNFCAVRPCVTGMRNFATEATATLPSQAVRCPTRSPAATNEYPVVQLTTRMRCQPTLSPVSGAVMDVYCLRMLITIRLADSGARPGGQHHRTAQSRCAHAPSSITSVCCPRLLDIVNCSKLIIVPDCDPKETTE